MTQRCVNHLFGYCQGQPVATVSTIVAGVAPDGSAMQYKAYIIGSCSKDWQTCPQYVTATESIKSAYPANHPG